MQILSTRSLLIVYAMKIFGGFFSVLLFFFSNRMPYGEIIHPVDIPPMFTRKDNFCAFLFASLQTKPFLNRGLAYREQILPF